MPVITLRTEIKAPIEVCFDLSRSIDLHLDTTRHTGEQAVAGVRSGLIGLGEFVTWRARHLWQHELTVRIEGHERPAFFRDAAVSGYFARFVHDHRFDRVDDETTAMTDRIEFRSPFGPIGDVVDALFLRWYLERFLRQRNRILKDVAEDPVRRRRFLRCPSGHVPPA